MRAVGNTVTVVCGNCGSSLDATDPDLAVLKRSMAAASRSRIPLGKRGFLAGIEWEAIGYLERSGAGGSWQETLIFNPWVGYRFLVDDGEVWRLGILLDQLPAMAGPAAVLGGDRYRLSERYRARVDFVVGEFYWRVAVGETVDVCDYTGPQGAMLSREGNAAEVAWTRLERQQDGVVESAFGIGRSANAAKAPPASGPSMPFASTLIAGIASGFLILVAALAPPSEQALVQTILVTPEGAAVTERLGPVAITRSSASLAVSADTNLENAWVDIDYTLVNRATQASYQAYTTAEYYTGYDDDGRWSEGNSRPDIAFSSVPRGEYDLVVEATAHNWQQSAISAGSGAGNAPLVVTIAVARNASIAGLFILALAALWIVPGLEWLWYNLQTRDE